MLHPNVRSRIFCQRDLMNPKPETTSSYARQAKLVVGAKIKFRGNSEEIDFMDSEIKIIANYVLKCDQHILLYIA